MRRINTKILIVLFSVCIISVLSVAIIGLNAILQSSKEQAKDFGEKSVEYNSTIIKTWLDEKSKLMVNIKDELIASNDYSSLESTLNRYSIINEDFISLFVGFEDNEMVDAFGWNPPDNYVVMERPWYQKAIDFSTTTATSVYEDKNKNRNVIAVATNIEIEGRKGVLAANVYADYLEEIVNSIQYGETGFALLMDENNHLITGSSHNLNQTKMEGLLDRINRITVDDAQSIFEVKQGDVTYLTSITTIEGYDWRLYLVAPIDDFMAPARNMMTQFIYIIFIIIVFVFLMDFYLSRTISQPIVTMMDSVSRLAGGDFDDEVNIKGNDEIAQLGKEVDKMRLNLKKIFDASKYESNLLSMNTKNLENHINETYKGTYNFMSLLSHDIKTPVTLIKGYTQAIKMGIIDDEKKVDYIERIAYRADQIEHIASDILDDTLDVNSLKIKLLPLNISDYIKMVIYNSENYVKNQKRVFVNTLNLNELPTDACIKIDIIKIQRVINNILSNAVKFSEESSKIELRIYEEDGWLVTSFKDYGQGVKEESIDMLFNMFYRASDHKSGYGLGLYISKAIIDLHLGEIVFASEIDQWTESGYKLKVFKDCEKEI